MMAPIFLIVALTILGVSKIAVTAVGRLTGLRSWLAAMALTVFICTIDHVIGYVYARTWVNAAKTSEVSTLLTNSIAFQYWEHPWLSTWYDSLGDRNHDPWPINTPHEFYASYLAWELGEGFGAVQGFAKNFTNDSTPRPMFEARTSTDPRDPACNWFDQLSQFTLSA